MCKSRCAGQSPWLSVVNRILGNRQKLQTSTNGHSEHQPIFHCPQILWFKWFSSFTESESYQKGYTSEFVPWRLAFKSWLCTKTFQETIGFLPTTFCFPKSVILIPFSELLCILALFPHFCLLYFQEQLAWLFCTSMSPQSELPLGLYCWLYFSWDFASSPPAVSPWLLSVRLLLFMAPFYSRFTPDNKIPSRRSKPLTLISHN